MFSSLFCRIVSADVGAGRRLWPVLCGINLARVTLILFASQKLKILKPIVAFVEILVVHFKACRNWPVERFPHDAMNEKSRVFRLFARGEMKVIVGPDGRFGGPEKRITRPRCAFSDASDSCIANPNSSADSRVAVPSRDQVFGKHYQLWSKPFPSLDSAKIPKVADLIKPFKSRDWFPILHDSHPINVCLV